MCSTDCNPPFLPCVPVWAEKEEPDQHTHIKPSDHERQRALKMKTDSQSVV